VVERTSESDDLRTVAEQAAIWRVSKATIYRLARLHGLPVVRLHDKADYRIDPEDAAAWLESRKVGA
jgi:excisionase family DNA binding protein